MRRAAIETNVAKHTIEPHHDAQRRHGTTSLGSDERSNAGREAAIRGEGVAEIWVDRDQASAAVLGRGIAQLDHHTDVAGWIEHHVPGQLGNLTGSQASLGGKQHDYTVTVRAPGAGSKNQEVVEVANGKYFCLLAWHIRAAKSIKN